MKNLRKCNSMEIVAGMVVKSMAGRDAGRFYVVVNVENKSVYIADGKLRRLEKPKRKNFVHVSITKKKVNLSEVKTNKSLRAFLRDYNYDGNI